MAERIEIIEEELAEARNSLFSGLRRVLMAGIGAVSLAQEEIDEFIDKLVDRGEIAEKDGRKLIDEIKERRRQKTKDAEEALDGRIERLLDRMNVPTKSDIEKLNAKITMLAEKVDALKIKQS